MTDEKTYSEFIVIHEKNKMTKDIDLLEATIESTIERVSDVVNSISDDDITHVSEELSKGINNLKKTLIKYNLYEL